MIKLVVFKGLPGSGKSTKAVELLRSKQGFVRINNDYLRTMLHDDVFSGSNEKLTQEALFVLAEHYLKEGVNVIIDNTNINPKTMERWNKFVDDLEDEGVKLEYEVIDMNISIDECIKRDMTRDKKVGAHVIKQMALQHGVHKFSSPVTIMDMDGTLADCSQRLHYIQKDPKDWKGFFGDIANDKPIEKVVNEFHRLADMDFPIVIVSARPEEYRETTEKWLRDNGLTKYFMLIMRQTGDRRDDPIVKREILNRYFPNRKDIIKVYDDRPRVIRMWREEGLEVVDCGNGIEF